MQLPFQKLDVAVPLSCCFCSSFLFLLFRITIIVIVGAVVPVAFLFVAAVVTLNVVFVLAAVTVILCVS